MKQFLKIMTRLFRPPTWLAFLVVFPSFALLIYVFANGLEETAYSYLSYAASAYSLAVVCVRMPDVISAFKTDFEKHPVLRGFLDSDRAVRYRSDKIYRAEISMYAGLVFGLLYACVKTTGSVLYHSPWLGALGVYYLLLSVLRLMMICYIRRKDEHKSVLREWKRYRLCGIVLLMMNTTLSAVVYLIVRMDNGAEYPGLFVYAAAAYTFYTVIVALTNLVHAGRKVSPVYEAGRSVNTVTAMISLLTLETAMISQFGTAEDAVFRRIITGTTGAVVCAGALFMAIYMIVRSTKQIRKMRISA